MWSKIIRGCVCGLLSLNVFNSSGIFLQIIIINESLSYSGAKPTSSLLWISLNQQVVKFLVERNSNNSIHGQVTIGTLIFQVITLFYCYTQYSYSELCMTYYFHFISPPDSLYSYLSNIIFHPKAFYFFLMSLPGRTVLLVYYLLCFLFLEVIVEFCKGCLRWEDCKLCFFFFLLSHLYKHLYEQNASCLCWLAFVICCRLLILSLFLVAASVLTWSFVPRFLKLMVQISSQVSNFCTYTIVMISLYKFNIAMLGLFLDLNESTKPAQLWMLY